MNKKLLWRNFKERNYLGDLRIGGRIILSISRGMDWIELAQHRV
jgi:hypothetical protein